MKSKYQFSAAILFAALSSMAQLVFAQLPPAESLVLGGVKLGDTRPMVMDAAKKLGLTMLKEGVYESQKLAYLDFAVKDYSIRDKNSLFVQFSPTSQKVIGISRAVYFEEKLPRSILYTKMVERFGKPQFRFGTDERNIVTRSSIEYGFDINGEKVPHVRCNPLRLPNFQASSECGLGIGINYFFDSNHPDYWTGQMITVFDYKTMYTELKALQDVKNKTESDNLKAAEKLVVPRL